MAGVSVGMALLGAPMGIPPVFFIATIVLFECQEATNRWRRAYKTLSERFGPHTALHRDASFLALLELDRAFEAAAHALQQELDLRIRTLKERGETVLEKDLVRRRKIDALSRDLATFPLRDDPQQVRERLDHVWVLDWGDLSVHDGDRNVFVPQLVSAWEAWFVTHGRTAWLFGEWVVPATTPQTAS